MKSFPAILLSAFAMAAAAPRPDPDSLKNGDLIFQTSRSGQSCSVARTRSRALW